MSIMALQDSLALRRKGPLLGTTQHLTVRPIQTEGQLGLLSLMLSSSLKRVGLQACRDVMYVGHMRDRATFFLQTALKLHLGLEHLDFSLPLLPTSISLLQELLATCTLLKVVQLGRETQSAPFLHALAELPHLQQLSLAGCNTVETIFPPLSAYGGFPALESISAIDQTAMHILQNTSSDHLRSLHVHSPALQSPTFVQLILSCPQLANLMSIRISCDQYQDPATSPSIITHLAQCHMLEKLHVEGFIPSGDRHNLLVLVRNWPQLRSLCWKPKKSLYPEEESNTYISLDIIGNISRACPLVQQVDLPVDLGLPWTSYPSTSMPTLKILDVSQWQVDIKHANAAINLIDQLCSSHRTPEEMIKLSSAEGTHRGFWTVIVWNIRNSYSLQRARAWQSGSSPPAARDGSTKEEESDVSRFIQSRTR